MMHDAAISQSQAINNLSLVFLLLHRESISYNVVEPRSVSLDVNEWEYLFLSGDLLHQKSLTGTELGNDELVKE